MLHGVLPGQEDDTPDGPTVSFDPRALLAALFLTESPCLNLP